MSSDEILKFMLRHEVVGFKDEPIELKSGRLSNWYVNWRPISGDILAIEKVGKFVAEYANTVGLKPDQFYGVPEGASILGVFSQYAHARNNHWRQSSRNGYVQSDAFPVAIGRSKPKDHGRSRDKHFVGTMSKDNVVVVEDVTTTGMSLLETIATLKDLDVNVIGAIGLTNRCELTPSFDIDEPYIVSNYKNIFKKATGKKYLGAMSVEEAVKAAGVDYHCLSEGPDVLKAIHEKTPQSPAIIRAIEEEFEKYGVKPLVLHE
jgi:orotate phosphoribosyltransferase